MSDPSMQQQQQPRQFAIGQMIFVLSNKSTANKIVILPGVVLEEIYYKRLDGQTVSYKIAIGPSGNQKIVDLTRVDGEIYGSIEEVRQAMLDKITDFVNGVCEEAEERARHWYGVQQQTQSYMNSGDKIDPAMLLNEVSVPTGMNPNQQQMHVNQQLYMSPPQPQQYMPPQQTLLRQRVADPDLLQREVVMEDGSVQKITMPK